MIIKREWQRCTRWSVGEYQDLGTVWESSMTQKAQQQVSGEMKLKSIPDKSLLYFGLFSWITFIPLFTHHLERRPGLINKPGDSFIHTSGKSVAEAKPRNMLWLRCCQKKPGCSRPAPLSAAPNTARTKHQQKAEGRIKQPLHFA